MSKPTESGKAQYQYMEAIMLELQKKQIHMSRSKNTVSAQVTFDEDFNIPDAKPDVGSVLLKQADAGGTSPAFRKGNHKRTSRL